MYCHFDRTVAKKNSLKYKLSFTCQGDKWHNLLCEEVGLFIFPFPGMTSSGRASFWLGDILHATACAMWYASC